MGPTARGALTGRIERRALVGVALAAALAAPACAEPAADSAPFTLASIGIKGTLIYKLGVYPETAPNDHRQVYNEGILQVEWARQLAPWLDLKLVGEARKDDAGFAEGLSFQIPETSEHRSVLSLKEAVARFTPGPVQVALGKQIFAWGTADAFNPTDNLNPADYLDPFDSEKIAVWSAAARATFGPADATLAVVPLFTPSRLPLSDSRWTPQPPPGFSSIVELRQLPAKDIGSLQYAARVRTTLGGWDLSVSYYEGFDTTPVYRTSTTDIGGVSVQTLTPVFTRVRVPGFDFSTTFGQLEVHGESAFRLVASNGRDNRFQWIGGGTYTWDELGFRWLQQVSLTVEYAREATLGRVDSSIAPFGTTGQVGDLLAPNAFRDAPIARLILKLDEDTQVRLVGIADLENEASGYAQARVTRRLGDAFQVTASYDVIWGASNTFWGRWHRNDRFFLTLKAFF